MLKDICRILSQINLSMCPNTNAEELSEIQVTTNINYNTVIVIVIFVSYELSVIVLK